MTSTAAGAWFHLQPERVGPSLYNTTDNDPSLRASSGSPLSVYPDDPLDKPDISVLCKLCGILVDLHVLSDHRRLHDALNIMKYKGSTRPESTSSLMQRRRTILRKINALRSAHDPPVDSDVIHKINDAYEFLKADIEETYEALRKVKDTTNTNVHGVAVNSGVGCVLAVGKCSDQNSRWKSIMEDASVFEDRLGGDPDKAFIGLYDGHHGPYAAVRAAEEFHHALLYELVKFDPTVKWTESIANKAHCMCNYETFGGPMLNLKEWEEEDLGIERDDGICTVYQVIRTYEDKLKQLEKEREATETDITVSRAAIIEKNASRKHKVEKKTRRPSGKRKYGNAYSEIVERAMVQAYKHTDLLLSWGREECSSVRWSGCSAFTAMIEGSKENELANKETARLPGWQDEEDQQENEKREPIELGRLHLAHAGNVKCVLVRGNQIHRLTKEHTPKNQRERARIIKLGGSITDSSQDVRVNGITSATRGLGNHGDVLLKTCVPITPYVTVVPIDEHAQFLVVASQGVWEVFSEEEATHILLEMLPCNHLPPPSHLATSIQKLLAVSRRPQSVGPSHAPVGDLMERLRAYSGGRKAVSVTRPDGCESVTGSRPAPTKRRHVIGDVGEPVIPEKHDLQTDMRSQGGFSDESGNEADADTCTANQYNSDMSQKLTRPCPGRDEIRREFAQMLAERLVQAAILAGTRANVTVMVVLLPGCGL